MPIAPLKPIASDTQQARVYNALARALMIGQFKPGEPITVRSLTEALGTGTMPAREALHRLVAKGALEFLPNRTASVPVFTAAEYEELCDIRIQLEGYATERAARHISDREIKAIDRSHQRIASLIKKMRPRSNPNSLLIANAQFHFGVYHAARSRHLVPLIEILWLRMGPLRLGPFLHTKELRTELDATYVQHKQLIAALKKRDAVMARKTMRDILTRAAGWYGEFNEFAEDNGSEHFAPVSDLVI